MKRLLAPIAALLIMSAQSAHSADPQPKLLVNKLDVKFVTRGLPLTSNEKLKSGTGKKKQVWKIKGQELGHFEVIGNNQNDADNVGWSCSEYDKQGNRIKEIGPDKFCHKFFVKVLRNVVDQPENLAKQLLNKAAHNNSQAAILNFGDISIETDREFYFLRRISRR